jgi:hypothetical protein
MKAHVGVDSKHKIVHTAVVTSANVSDAAVLPADGTCASEFSATNKPMG